MYPDDNDWEPTFDALTAGTYWSLLPRPKALQCVNWTAFVARCRRALRRDVSQTAVASVQEAEVYERVLDLVPGGYYRLVWSVDAARRISRQHALQPRQIQARNLLAGVVVHDLDFGRVAQVDPQQGTVLFGDFPLLEEQIVVIDGNHRIYRACQRGENVSAVHLDEVQMVAALLHDHFRTLYAVHWNLSRWTTIELTGDRPPDSPWMPLTPDDDQGVPLLT